MQVIASPHNPTIKRIRSLAEKKHRQAEGLFVAEGEKVLARARAEGWEPVYLVSLKPVEAWGKSQRLLVNEKIMAALSAQANPPAEIGVFRQHWQAQPSRDGLWLALENIRDPGNLGTIIRTADAVSAKGIILAGQACDPWGADCVRATMGSIFAVPLVKMETKALIALAREWPGDVVGTHLGARDDYRRSYREPLLLIMGSETRGLTPELAAACSVLVRIPMRAQIDSLNIGAATAIMLFEIRRDSGTSA